jgi:catechol 2,3-dioxygenase-like lactoylglutathione lyase family enzyme
LIGEKNGLVFYSLQTLPGLRPQQIQDGLKGLRDADRLDSGTGISREFVMQTVVPAIRVASYEKARSFYAKLGFVEQWTHQFKPGFPVFASIARGSMQVFLTEHTGDCQFGALVHFYVPDVDACHAEFLQQGVPITDPPGHGLGPNIRHMIVTDPDGNRLSFITLKSG